MGWCSVCCPAWMMWAAPYSNNRCRAFWCSVVFKPLSPFSNPERRWAELSKAIGPTLYMLPGQLGMQNESCKWSHTVPHFPELLGIVYTEQADTQQQDDMVRLCKHICFSSKISLLLQGLMQFCWKSWCRDHGITGFPGTCSTRLG